MPITGKLVIVITYKVGQARLRIISGLAAGKACKGNLPLDFAKNPRAIPREGPLKGSSAVTNWIAFVTYDSKPMRHNLSHNLSHNRQCLRVLRLRL